MGQLKLKNSSQPSLLNVKTQEVFTITNGLIMGRSSECGIIINDTKVSRNHLVFKIDEQGDIWIKDQSTNGTFVNNTKITSETKINNSSVLKIGNNEFKVLVNPIITQSSETISTINQEIPKLKLIDNIDIDYNEYPPASTFKRLIASIIDGAILTIALKLPELLTKQVLTPKQSDVIIFFFSIVLVVAYYKFMYNRNGQSIGKNAMKIKVISTDERKTFSTWRILGREFLLKNIFGFLSAILVIFGKKKLAVHDRINNTRVIDISKSI